MELMIYCPGTQIAEFHPLNEQVHVFYIQACHFHRAAQSVSQNHQDPITLMSTHYLHQD